jgi:hypothetical protein
MTLHRMFAVLAASALLITRAPAQDKDAVPTIPFDGSEVFCYLLKSRGLSPVRSIDELRKLAPVDTLVIHFGRPGELGYLRDFQRRGGAILFASDYSCRIDDYGLAVANDTVRQAAADRAFGKNHDCPLISAFEPGIPSAFHKPARGLATNRPSYFVCRPDAMQAAGLRLLASFPNGCHGTRDSSVVRPPYLLIGAETAAVRGRALFCAGQGMFTNGMLLQTAADNFPFALDCLHWLGESPDGKARKHALFIVDGDIVQSFDVSLKPPLPPVPMPTVALVNQLLRGMEQEGFLERILHDTVDVHQAVRVGLVVLTVCLLLYGVKKFSEQRHYAEKGSVLLLGPFAARADTSPLLHQRLQSQVERDALWEEARALVRAWLFEVSAIPPAAWDDGAPAPRPVFLTAGGWWEQFRMRRRVNRLIQLAGQQTAAPLSWAELVLLTGVLQSLNDAVQQDRLRFAGCHGEPAVLAAGFSGESGS